MHRVINVEPLESFRLNIVFEDGTEGIVDLSDLAGRGVFALWQDYAEFRKVRIGEHGELIWSEQIDMCPDALYLKVTGKMPGDIFPTLQRNLKHA
jgi:hypothetical protein